MGSNGGSKVSRHEGSVDKPLLENVLAYEIIFRLPARGLFAGIFEAVQMLVHRRVRTLIEKLERTDGCGGTASKLAALRLIVESNDRKRRNGGDA